MLQPGVGSVRRTMGSLRSLGIAARGRSLLLILLALATSSAVVGVGVQIAPAGEASDSRLRELEAMFASSRCGATGNASSTQEDARSKP